MKNNCTNSAISNQEKRPAADPGMETGRKVPDENGPEGREESGKNKKIERCEPCLHCGSHCIYLNKE